MTQKRNKGCYTGTRPTGMSGRSDSNGARPHQPRSKTPKYSSPTSEHFQPKGHVFQHALAQEGRKIVFRPLRVLFIRTLCGHRIPQKENASTTKLPRTNHSIACHAKNIRPKRSVFSYDTNNNQTQTKLISSSYVSTVGGGSDTKPFDRGTYAGASAAAGTSKRVMFSWHLRRYGWYLLLRTLRTNAPGVIASKEQV